MSLTLRIASLLTAACALIFASCDDDVSPIGGSLVQGEVAISVDSITTEIPAETVYYDAFDSRTLTKLLGRLSVPQYGELECSFVAQMMSAQKMLIPDSIGVADLDSMRLVLTVPRGALTGDSLAPQQLRVYRLERQLPSPIASNFNPEGYYSAASLMGTKSYTISNIARGDSAMKASSTVRIPVRMPLDFARDLFEKYRAGSSIFDWPASFNQYFPGIYVEQNFGNGCVANISKAEFFTYWHRVSRTLDMQPDSTYKYVDHIVRDSTCLLASQPEVLSSNIISYTPSDYIKNFASANSVITSPGGYMVHINFPAQTLLDAYHRHGASMQMVSSLKFQIPANEVKNDYGITLAPNLLMVKRTELESFFAENKIPDAKTSFYAAYDSESGSYRFDNMRAYFLSLLEKEQAGEPITADDTDFVLVPVDVTLETTQGYNSVTVSVTRCAPYLLKPTMTHLHTERAIICFTYSTQQID